MEEHRLSIAQYHARDWLTGERPFRLDCHKTAVWVEIHSHNYFEILYTVQGQGRYIADGMVHEIEPGAIFLCPWNESQKIIVYPSPELSIVNFSFLPEFVDPILQGRETMDLSWPAHWEPFSLPPSHRRVPLLDSDKEWVKTLIDRLIEENAMRRPDHWEVTHCLFKLFLKSIARGFAGTRPVPISRYTATPRILQVMEYLDRHYRETPSLQAVAEMAGLSRSRFSNLFHEMTGLSFVQYLHDVRLSAACLKLRFSNARISDISTAVGFEELSHFSRTFKKRMGVTPGDYRTAGLV